MKIQTFSIVAGTQACNARCPFCVSQMTGMDELPSQGHINKQNLRKAIHLAQLGGCTTVLITGKGEPTLYPEQIRDYLSEVGYKFPFIELQTNGLLIGRLAEGRNAYHMSPGWLKHWFAQGLNTIALSVVSADNKVNAATYHKEYPDLGTTVNFLHSLGFSVRLCLMMMNGGVCTWDSLNEVISFCRQHGVEQLTARSIARPAKVTCKDSYTADEYVEAHELTRGQVNALRNRLDEYGTLLMKLEHGAEVYDVHGQNVALSDCLTPPKDENLRQLIFYSDGRLTYDWQHKGAVLLGGTK